MDAVNLENQAKELLGLLDQLEQYDDLTPELKGGFIAQQQLAHVFSHLSASEEDVISQLESLEASLPSQGTMDLCSNIQNDVERVHDELKVLVDELDLLIKEVDAATPELSQRRAAQCIESLYVFSRMRRIN